ncbi:MAG: S9 family peptidase [Proteobacteria bacterium]|nr:S9 family peptidase [Pseudomonadota bacterium]
MSNRLTLERIFNHPGVNGRTPVRARFSPPGNMVSFLLPCEENSEQSDLWLFDIATGDSTRLVDAAGLTRGQTLSHEEKASRERKRIVSTGIVEYQWSPGGDAILFPLEGGLYVCHLANGQTTRIGREDHYAIEPRFSPAGDRVCYVANKDLWVINMATTAVVRLTSDASDTVSNGLAEFLAQEEMHRFEGFWWSPDAARIAFTRVDESPIEISRRYEINADSFGVYEQRYPFTGTHNATVSLGVITLATNETRMFDLDLEDGYLARVNWLDDETLALQIQDRPQQRLQLVQMNPATGNRRLLLQETSDTWINLHDHLLPLADRGGFIWSSERSGYAHLYLYDSSGKLVRQLTSGPWCVLGVHCADQDYVYFEGYQDSPTERHLYRVRLNGQSPPERLTEPGSYHTAVIDKDRRFFLDVQSSSRVPPAINLRRMDGSRIEVPAFEDYGPTHPFHPYRDSIGAVEFGQIPADDGQQLQYRLVMPLDMDSRPTHPVIVVVYGGPGVQRVTNEWITPWTHYMSQQGFGILQLDNRGSAHRGRAFEGPIRGELGTIEVKDQLRGVEYLGTLPWVDMTRLGVFGHSYGGYMTLMLMMRSTAFRAGVSVAPVTDWRLYDTHYTERFLGMPEDNPAGYRRSSVFEHLQGLSGNLLLIHGMADDNVLFTNSTRLYKALQDANQPFEMMTYPGAKHGLSGRTVNLHRYMTMQRFFARHLFTGDEA